MSIVKKINRPDSTLPPQVTFATLDLSWRTTPVPVTLNASTYNADGRYTLVTWTTILTPSGLSGARMFDVAPPSGRIVRNVQIIGNSLVADLVTPTYAT